MEKILFVTGKDAENGLKMVLRKNKIPGEIHVCKVNVAAFITPEVLMNELSEKKINFDKVILSGKTNGDFSAVEKKFNIKVVKGPECFMSLPEFLKLEKKNTEKYFSELKNERSSFAIGKNKKVFLNRKISRVIAEIVDAPKLREKELIERAKYYEKSGAEILDIGMVANEDNSKKIPKIIETLRKKTNLPLSIDTLNKKEILTAINSGIDLIISLDFSNYEVAEKIKVPFVIIPRDEKGNVPKNAEERITLVERLMKKSNNKNFVVDMILNPVGMDFSESLKAFIMFRKKYPQSPMMMGLGNVTELMDVDSVGVNGLLAGIASELNIGLLLTTEASQKTKNSVKELSKAAKMMFLAKCAKQTPKNLGMNLLVLKDKEKYALSEKNKNLKVITTGKVEEDKLEIFSFMIFLKDEKINVLLYEGKKPKLKFLGTSAEDLYKRILSKNFINSLEHAAYLGRELGKAEIALQLGKNYIQDEELFKV